MLWRSLGLGLTTIRRQWSQAPHADPVGFADAAALSFATQNKPKT